MAYVAGVEPHVILDPAVGAGAFLLAARAISTRTRRPLSCVGTEVDPAALAQAQDNGLSQEELRGVQIGDFLQTPPEGPFPAIVANPPYVRHHRLSPQVKARLRLLATGMLGTPLDGRAGLHVYFLLQSLRLLAPGGRLSFILPADTCEGVFSQPLWAWVGANYRLDAVVTFSPAASPFPTLDTNPLIVMIANAPPKHDLLWARCDTGGLPDLTEWVLHGFHRHPGPSLVVSRRPLAEALRTGLSRPPPRSSPAHHSLGDFARVVRGVATGANAFFHLTRQRAALLGIPEEHLVPAIGRTRDVDGEELTEETLAALDQRGRPTLLFTPDSRPVSAFPEQVRAYLKQGESAGLPTRPLLASRRPWYAMERRTPPPILFAYLGRRNARFILNAARAVPLTGFLCVYPRVPDPAYTRRLWAALRDPDTRAGLVFVAKSYGGGALKVEPRALERLPIPDAVLRSTGLRVPDPPRLPLDCPASCAPPGPDTPPEEAPSIARRAPGGRRRGYAPQNRPRHRRPSR